MQRANITWLKARARALGTRGLSELLDRIVTDARAKAPAGEVRSVVGTIDLDPVDPLLMGADEVLRSLVEASVTRPSLVKADRVTNARKRRSRRG